MLYVYTNNETLSFCVYRTDVSYTQVNTVYLVKVHQLKIGFVIT